MNTDNTAGSAAPAGPSDEGRADAWLLKVHAHLQEALRIPTMPWPDPGAHGHEATARAIHASYCALRFKVIDAIAELTATRVAITGLLADRATRGAAGAEGMVPRAVLIEQTAPGEAEAVEQIANKLGELDCAHRCGIGREVAAQGAGQRGHASTSACRLDRSQP